MKKAYCLTANKLFRNFYLSLTPCSSLQRHLFGWFNSKCCSLTHDPILRSYSQGFQQTPPARSFSSSSLSCSSSWKSGWLLILDLLLSLAKATFLHPIISSTLNLQEAGHGALALANVHGFDFTCNMTGLEPIWCLQSTDSRVYSPYSSSAFLALHACYPHNVFQ